MHAVGQGGIEESSCRAVKVLRVVSVGEHEQHQGKSINDKNRHSNTCGNKVSFSILFSIHFIESGIVLRLVRKKAVQKQVAGNADSAAKNEDEMVPWHHLVKWEIEFPPRTEAGVVQNHR